MKYIPTNYVRVDHLIEWLIESCLPDNETFQFSESTIILLHLSKKKIEIAYDTINARIASDAPHSLLTYFVYYLQLPQTATDTFYISLSPYIFLFFFSNTYLARVHRSPCSHICTTDHRPRKPVNVYHGFWPNLEGGSFLVEDSP